MGIGEQAVAGAKTQKAPSAKEAVAGVAMGHRTLCLFSRELIGKGGKSKKKGFVMYDGGGIAPRSGITFRRDFSRRATYYIHRWKERRDKVRKRMRETRIGESAPSII